MIARRSADPARPAPSIDANRSRVAFALVACLLLSAAAVANLPRTVEIAGGASVVLVTTNGASASATASAVAPRALERTSRMDSTASTPCTAASRPCAWRTLDLPPPVGA